MVKLQTLHRFSVHYILFLLLRRDGQYKFLKQNPLRLLNKRYMLDFLITWLRVPGLLQMVLMARMGIMETEEKASSQPIMTALTG